MRRLAIGIALTLSPLAVSFALAAAGSQGAAFRHRLLEVEARRAPTSDDLRLLQRGLQSPSVAIQRLAVRALGRLERPSLIPLIEPMLTAADPGVRAEAANAVAQALSGGEGAGAAGTVAGTLVGRLRTEHDATVRASLLEALGRLPYKSPDDGRTAETTLTAALEPGSSGEAVAGAARGLYAFARAQKAVAPQTAERLRAMVRHSPAGVDESATRVRRLCLGALVFGSALDLESGLLVMKDSDPEMRRLGVGAALARADTLDRAAVIKAGLTDRAWRVRYDALRAYGRRMQGRDGCGPLVEAVKDDNLHVRLVALDLLGDPCPDATDGSVPVLSAAAHEADWHLAGHALVSLARRSAEATQAVLAKLASHPVWLARTYAARAAALARAEDTLERLASDAKDNVREAALLGLSTVKGHAADDRFIAALSAKDYPLVIAAARALEGTPRRREATTALLVALRRLTVEGRDTSRDTRVAILKRLRELGGTGDSGSLLAYLGDVDPIVAAEAAATLEAWTGRGHRTHSPPWRIRDMPTIRELERFVGPDTGRSLRARVTLASGSAFEVRLLGSEAPLTVTRFVRRARAGYYDGLTWHRVEPTFVIQGGSPGASEEVGDGAYMRDELGLRTHARGTVGLSTRGRDTGDAQWFVNLVDNPRLDHRYTVFGQVVSGMEVVDGIVEGDAIRTIAIVERAPDPH